MKKTKASAAISLVKPQEYTPFIQYPRSAGVLLHITSLPSLFAVGDFGPEAYAFADFLYRSKQTVWQILPINSTSPGQGFAPYGSDGCFAGNTILISPEKLAQEGLLTKQDIKQNAVKNSRKTNYDKAQKMKELLLHKAFLQYKKTGKGKDEFAQFCQQEIFWLNDYALYIALKRKYNQQSWNEWEEPFKNCDRKALEAFAKANADELEEIKWRQWIFFKQWNELKAYCNNLNIKIFGDIPFYVSYDSVDVWMKRYLFNLDKNGKMLSEGGAPPDDFNAEGQRWGFPVYRWDVQQKQNFDWWLNRMKRNAELFDLVRLDHFRGFSAYWDIPVEAKSAKDGHWKPTPGQDLFSLLQKELGSLPFVAEDLGTIDEPVIQLRDEFSIPGMIIQQVSFGEDMPQSTSIPHHHHENAIVYTGNHDNNTLLGWYNSLPSKFRKNISLYTNRAVTKSTVGDVFRHLVYASVAKLAILPVQDILELGEESRMNSVPNGGKSWAWRMPAKATGRKYEKILSELCYLYDREGKDSK